MLITSEKDKLRAVNQIKELDLSEGKQYRHTLKRYRKKRTISQNSLYWKWLAIIEYETGNSQEYLHDYFRKEYLGFVKAKVTYPSEAIELRLRSTTSLDTKEFSVYLDKIDLEIKESGLNIPLVYPKDKEFDKIMEYYSDVIE